MLWRGPRQEIQLSSLLTTALLVPLSADRSATELSITRLASELFAILASELLHLSLHAKESRLFLSTTCDWRCSGSQPNLQLHHHLHLHRVVLVPHPQDHQARSYFLLSSLLYAVSTAQFPQHTGAFIFISVINIKCKCS